MSARAGDDPAINNMLHKIDSKTTDVDTIHDEKPSDINLEIGDINSTSKIELVESSSENKKKCDTVPAKDCFLSKELRTGKKDNCTKEEDELSEENLLVDKDVICVLVDEDAIEKNVSNKEDGELSNLSENNDDYLILSDCSLSLSDISTVPDTPGFDSNENNSFIDNEQTIHSPKLSELERKKKNLRKLVAKLNNKEEIENLERLLKKAKHKKKNKKHKGKKKSKKKMSKKSQIKCVAVQELASILSSVPDALVEENKDAENLFPTLSEVNLIQDHPNNAFVISKTVIKPVTTSKSPSSTNSFESERKKKLYLDEAFPKQARHGERNFIPRVRNISPKYNQHPRDKSKSPQKTYHLKQRTCGKKIYHSNHSSSPKRRHHSRDSESPIKNLNSKYSTSPNRSHHSRYSTSPNNRGRSDSPQKIYHHSREHRTLSSKKIHHSNHGSSPKRSHHSRDRESPIKNKSHHSKYSTSTNQYHHSKYSTSPKYTQHSRDRSLSPKKKSRERSVLIIEPDSSESLSGSIPFVSKSEHGDPRVRRKRRGRRSTSSQSSSSSRSSSQSEEIKNFLAKCREHKKIIDTESKMILQDIEVIPIVDPPLPVSNPYDSATCANPVPAAVPTLQYSCPPEDAVSSLSLAQHNPVESIVQHPSVHFSHEQIVPCQNESYPYVSFTPPSTLFDNNFISDQTDRSDHSNISNYDAVSMESVSIMSFNEGDSDFWKDNIPTRSGYSETRENNCFPFGNTLLSNEIEMDLNDSLTISVVNTNRSVKKMPCAQNARNSTNLIEPKVSIVNANKSVKKLPYDENATNSTNLIEPKVSIINTNKSVKKLPCAESATNSTNLIEPKVSFHETNEEIKTEIFSNESGTDIGVPTTSCSGNREIICDTIKPEFILNNNFSPNFPADDAAKFLSELQHVMCVCVHNPTHNSDVLLIEKWFALINTIYQDLIYKKNKSTLSKMEKYKHLFDFFIDYFQDCKSKAGPNNTYSDQFPQYITRLEVLKLLLSQKKQHASDEKLSIFIKKHNVAIKNFFIQKQMKTQMQILPNKVDANSTSTSNTNKEKRNINILTNKINSMYKLKDGPSCYEMFERISMESLKYLLKRVSCELLKSEADAYILKCQELIQKKIQLSNIKDFLEKLQEKALKDKNSISSKDINQLAHVKDRLSSWRGVMTLLKQAQEIFKTLESLHPESPDQNTSNERNITSEPAKEISFSTDLNSSPAPISILKQPKLDLIDFNMNNNNTFSNSDSLSKETTNKQVSEQRSNMITADPMKMDQTGSNTSQSNKTAQITDQYKDNSNRSNIEGTNSQTTMITHSSVLDTDDLKANQIQPCQNLIPSNIDFNLIKTLVDSISALGPNVGWGNNLDCVINTNQSYLNSKTCNEPSHLRLNHQSCSSKDSNKLQNHEHNILALVTSNLKYCSSTKSNDSFSTENCSHQVNIDKDKPYTLKDYDLTKAFLKNEKATPHLRNVNPVCGKTSKKELRIDTSIPYKLQDYKVNIPNVRYREQIINKFNFHDPRLQADKKRLDREKGDKIIAIIDNTDKKTEWDNIQNINSDFNRQKVHLKDPRLQKSKEIISDQNSIINSKRKSIEEMLCNDSSAWSRVPFRSSNEEAPLIKQSTSFTDANNINEKRCFDGNKSATQSSEIIKTSTSDFASHISKDLVNCKNTKNYHVTGDTTDVKVSEPIKPSASNEVKFRRDSRESYNNEQYNTEKEKRIKIDSKMMESKIEILSTDKNTLLVNHTKKDNLEQQQCYVKTKENNENQISKNLMNFKNTKKDDVIGKTTAKEVYGSSGANDIKFRRNSRESYNHEQKNIEKEKNMICNEKVVQVNDSKNDFLEEPKVNLKTKGCPSQVSKDVNCKNTEKDYAIVKSTSINVAESIKPSRSNEVKFRRNSRESNNHEQIDRVFHKKVMGSKVETSNENSSVLKPTNDVLEQSKCFDIKENIEKGRKSVGHLSSDTKENPSMNKNKMVQKSEKQKKVNCEKTAKDIKKANQNDNDIKSIIFKAKNLSNSKTNLQFIDIFNKVPKSSRTQDKNNITDVRNQESLDPKSCCKTKIKEKVGLNTSDKHKIQYSAEARKEGLIFRKEKGASEKFTSESSISVSLVKNIIMETPFLRAFRNDTKLFKCSVVIQTNDQKKFFERYGVKRKFYALEFNEKEELVLSKKKKIEKLKNNNTSLTQKVSLYGDTCKLVEADLQNDDKISPVFSYDNINSEKKYPSENNDIKKKFNTENFDETEGKCTKTNKDKNAFPSKSIDDVKEYSKSNNRSKVCSADIKGNKKTCNTECQKSKNICGIETNETKLPCSKYTNNKNKHFKKKLNKADTICKTQKLIGKEFTSKSHDKKYHKESNKAFSTETKSTTKNVCAIIETDHTNEDKKPCSTYSIHKNNQYTEKNVNKADTISKAKNIRIESTTKSHDEKYHKESSNEAFSADTKNTTKKVCAIIKTDDITETKEGKKPCKPFSINENNQYTKEIVNRTDTIYKAKNIRIESTTKSHDEKYHKESNEAFSADTKSTTEEVCAIIKTDDITETKESKKPCSPFLFNEIKQSAIEIMNREDTICKEKNLIKKEFTEKADEKHHKKSNEECSTDIKNTTKKDCAIIETATEVDREKEALPTDSKIIDKIQVTEILANKEVRENVSSSKPEYTVQVRPIETSSSEETFIKNKDNENFSSKKMPETISFCILNDGNNRNPPITSVSSVEILNNIPFTIDSKQVDYINPHFETVGNSKQLENENENYKISDDTIDSTTSEIKDKNETSKPRKLNVKNVWNRIKRQVVNSKVTSISKALTNVSSGNELQKEPADYMLKSFFENKAPQSFLESQSTPTPADKSIPKVILLKRYSVDSKKEDSNDLKPPIKVNLRRSSEDTWVQIKHPDETVTVPTAQSFIEITDTNNINPTHKMKKHYAKNQDTIETTSCIQQLSRCEENKNNLNNPEPHQRKALSEIYSCRKEILEHDLERRSEHVDFSSSLDISSKPKPTRPCPKSRKRKSILDDELSIVDNYSCNNPVEAQDETIIFIDLVDHSNELANNSFDSNIDKDTLSSDVLSSHINKKKIRMSKLGKFNIEHFIKEDSKKVL